MDRNEKKEDPESLKGLTGLCGVGTNEKERPDNAEEINITKKKVDFRPKYTLIFLFGLLRNSSYSIVFFHSSTSPKLQEVLHF